VGEVLLKPILAAKKSGWGMAGHLEKAKQFLLRPRPFEQLFLVNNWAGSLAPIVAGMIISFFLFGFWWPYWRIADMDFPMVYQAFLFNDGLPQEYFDHPGYLTALLLSHWFRLLHAIGLLQVHALSALPPPAEAEPAWTAAIRAGRILSLGLSIAFVLAFATLLRRLIGNWRVASLAACFLAFSGGVAMHERVIRTELLSAGLVIISLLILLVAGRTPRTPWRPLLVGLSASLAVLALTNKVQVILLICALPLIVLPFGVDSDQPGGFWRTSRLAFPLLVLLAIWVVLIAIPAGPLAWFGLSAVDTPAFPWRPLPGGLSGVYQPIIAVYLALAIVGFGVTWGVSALETLATMLAVVGGIGLGLLSLDLNYNPQNVLIVMNPLEHLFSFAMSNEGFAQGGLIASLVNGVGGVIARRTFILYSSPRPTIFLEWLVIVATFAAWKAGERKLAGQVAALMLVVWGFDTVGTLRGLKLEYFIYTDPLVIIAAAWLVAQWVELRHHRWAFQIGALLVWTHLVVSQAEPIKHTLMRSEPLEFCGPHMALTKRIERFPFCPAVRPAAVAP
jgi:hypothetical protein